MRPPKTLHQVSAFLFPKYEIRFQLLIIIAVILTAARSPASTGVFTNILSFDGTNGAQPSDQLIQGENGLIYGTTTIGGPDGTNGGGTIFQMTPSGALTTLHFFSKSNVYFPVGGVIFGTDGNLYGTAAQGGNDWPPYGGAGCIFEMTPMGDFTDLFDFDVTNGAWSYAPLLPGSDGYLYGTTMFGGSDGDGTVFRISTNGAFDSLYSFKSANGAFPQAGLVLGTDGAFYGATPSADIAGNIFKISTDGLSTDLFSFNFTNGAYPFSGLLLGRDGNFYGTTFQGGQSYGNSNSLDGQGYGTVYKLTSNGVLTTLFSFQETNGAYPVEALIQANDGQLYGTTSSGGIYANDLFGYAGYGTLFRITTNGLMTLLYSFDQTNGSNPSGGLMQAADGSLYGTTVAGGDHDLGTIYQFRLALPLGINCPAAVTNECGDSPTTILATLTNSSNDELTAVWSVNQQPIQTNTFSGQINALSFQEQLSLGTNIVTLSVNSSFGDAASASTIVTAFEAPPVIVSAAAMPSVLRPERGGMVPVRLDAVVQGYCSPATWKITGVQRAVPTTERGELWRITGPHTVSLRAVQDRRVRNRVYYVTIEAIDEFGQASPPFVVAVPVQH